MPGSKRARQPLFAATGPDGEMTFRAERAVDAQRGFCARTRRGL